MPYKPVENIRFARLLNEFSTIVTDLSTLSAKVDIFYIQLEAYEPGLWWDLVANRRRVNHPAIAQWLTHYGYTSFHELSPVALYAYTRSLEKRLDQLSAPDLSPPVLAPGG